MVSVQQTIFWHAPDATEGEIRAAKEKAVQRFYCTVQRRNVKKKGKVVSRRISTVFSVIGKGSTTVLVVHSRVGT